jgi:hypothetical protein
LPDSIPEREKRSEVWKLSHRCRYLMYTKQHEISRKLPLVIFLDCIDICNKFKIENRR